MLGSKGTKLQDILQVFLKRLSGLICFKTVDRNADPVQGWGRKQDVLFFFEQGSICGERYL